MKVRKRETASERLILTAMIVDPVVLGRIASKWQDNMFRNRWSNLIAVWCVRYYHRYDKAPGNQIENLFDSWSNKTKDKETIIPVEKFLDSLSKDYENLNVESNSDYIIDVAGRYFNQVKMEKLIETIQDDLDINNIDKAQKQIVGFSKIDMGVGEGIDILQDTEAIKEAFRDRRESLITYPGALGKFFKDALERDAFISFMAPEKRGKTFWLIDMAYRAMIQRKKVAFFETGDLSQNQIMRRLMIRVSGRPFYPCTVNYPTDITMTKGDEIASVDTKRKTCTTRLSWRKANKACRSAMKKAHSKKSFFRLSCHPNSTLFVKGIQNILEDWAREEWVPDIIIIDYADILNMQYHGLEGRDRVNEAWKQLRSLSQTYHCLVVTATQSDAASYGAKTIRMKHFSEDKRKLAHVTGMIGINCTKDEKEEGIMRLNWIALRESDFNVDRFVHVAGCLAISNPAIKSCFEE